MPTLVLIKLTTLEELAKAAEFKCDACIMTEDCKECIVDRMWRRLEAAKRIKGEGHA